MSRQFEPRRAVEITAPNYGSAYRIGGRLILTAKHLFERRDKDGQVIQTARVGDSCQIRDKQNAIDKQEATVVWLAQTADVALVELPGEFDSEEPIVFGHLPNDTTGGAKIAFQMYGYPQWARTQRNQGSAAGGSQVEGTIYLADTSPDQSIVLRISEQLTSEYLLNRGSEWSGMSGAAVVCNGLVVAVQKQHQRPVQTNRIEAEPLLKVYNDPQWQNLLQQHGISFKPQIVQLEAAAIWSPITIIQLFTQANTSLSQYICIQEFRNLINERTRNFVGREFIFKAIKDSLEDPEFPSGYIIVYGEPGIGKSSLIAQLIKQEGSVHHFNIALQNICSPQKFLANVCAQLIVRYELNYPVLPPEATKDSGFLSQLLSEVASKAQQPISVLIDALDEAEDIRLYSNANRLYLPPVLPEGVFFVVTTREEHDYHLNVERHKDIYLRDDDPRNLDDVRQYIRNYVQKHYTVMAQQIKLWCIDEDEFVTIITEKSEGNFMYLTYVLCDIRDGRLTAANVDNINKLPKGLRDYYQRHWRTMKNQEQERFELYYEPVVCMLATVREPVFMRQLVEWTRLDPRRVKEVIQVWREFLNEIETEEGETLYRIYHTSFQDFLKDEVGLSSYNSKIAQSILDKIQW